MQARNLKKYIAKLENTKSERNGKKKEIECGNLRIFIPKYDLNFDNVYNENVMDNDETKTKKNRETRKPVLRSLAIKTSREGF